jgi:hypothetical protein
MSCCRGKFRFAGQIFGLSAPFSITGRRLDAALESAGGLLASGEQKKKGAPRQPKAQSSLRSPKRLRRKKMNNGER